MFLILGKYFLFDYIGLANEIQKGNYENFRIQNFFDFINLNRIFLVFKYILFYSLEVLIYPISIIILLILINFDKKKSIYFIYGKSFNIKFGVYTFGIFTYLSH